MAIKRDYKRSGRAVVVHAVVVVIVGVVVVLVVAVVVVAQDPNVVPTMMLTIYTNMFHSQNNSNSDAYGSADSLSR